MKVQELGAVMCLEKPIAPDNLRRSLALVGIEVS